MFCSQSTPVAGWPRFCHRPARPCLPTPPPGPSFCLWSQSYLTLELCGRFQHYYSEFIQYPTHHNASGVLWKNTWDNFGRAEDAATLTDDINDEYQRNQIFLETVANEVFKTAVEFFPEENFLRWIFGWLVGFLQVLG